MKIIAVISQKGGAGKTTLAVHLAVAAPRAGEPRGNATGAREGVAAVVNASKPNDFWASGSVSISAERLIVVVL